MNSNYNFEYLVLLVGTNPLPNFVAADYFLRHNKNLKTIILIYSEETNHQRGTFNYAENIKKLINNRHKNRQLEFCFIKLTDIGMAKDIRYDIINNNNLKKVPNEISLNFNYTGGTKAMAIHGYQVIKKMAEGKNWTVNFSYLDARRFCLIDDQQGVITSDLRSEIKLDINELIELHNFTRNNQARQDIFNNAIEVFKDLIEKGKIDKYFESYERELFKNQKGELIRRKNEIKDDLRKYKANDPLLSVIKKMPEEFILFDSEGKFIEPKSDDKLAKAVRFIDGEWLEWYIYKLLKEKYKNHRFTIDIDWQIKKPGWNKDFQIDIILVNGYQPIGISCTTSNKISECKNKGFEILHRIRQIGGEEARAVLVTFLPNEKMKDLEEELKIDTGGAENIYVFGVGDLKSKEFYDKFDNLII